MSLGVIVTLVFVLSAAGIGGACYVLAGRADAALRRRVEGRLQEMSGAAAGGAADGEAGSLVKTHAAGPLPTVDAVARRTARGSALERWIAQAGMAISVSGLLLISVVAATVSGTVATLIWRHPLAGTVGLVVGLLAPLAVVRHRRSARLRTFEERFPEALDLISRAIRAGHAFSAGLKMVADEVDDPVGPEFRTTFDEQNFGLPLKESLNNLVDRVPILDVRFFATAVLIQRDTGGNLSEILDNLAGVVRERFTIRRQIRVHTAHGRLTGYVLMALPAFLAVALSVINPEHMAALFQEQMGQTMLIGAIVMQVVGFLWIQRVVKIEV